MAAEAAAAKKSSGGWSRLVLWLVVLALLGVVWWLASERNERRFRLTSQAGKLLIERGRFFPNGTSAIAADDAVWGRLYGPVTLPAAVKPPGDLEFEDQNALDRTLLELLTGGAREAAKKGDTASMELAAQLVGRANLLPGLTAAQLAQVAALRGDLAWDEARADLAQAQGFVQSARRKLELVRQGNAARAGDAAVLQGRLLGLEAELRGAAEGRAPAPEANPVAVGLPASATSGSAAPADAGSPASAAPAAPDAGAADGGVLH